MADLAAAGTQIIQVDEAALRETIQLRLVYRPDHLTLAVEACQLATAGVDDAMQVHTRMCPADFEDIFIAIVAMDADVIGLEATRSDGDRRRVDISGPP